MYPQIFLPMMQTFLPILLVQAVNSKDIFDTEGAKKEWNDLIHFNQGISIVNNSNKPKGLKVTKEDQRSIGSMVNRLDGQ